MKLTISQIPAEGRLIHFNPKEGWVQQMIREALPDEDPAMESLEGEVRIIRFDANLNLSGALDIVLHPECVRCMEPFGFPFHLDVKMDLTPLHPSEREKEEARGFEEEIELTKDDLNFSFYDGPEINLQDLLREQIVLSLPLCYVCNEECRGLCPQCGINLNQKSCRCSGEGKIDLRWEELKKWKG